MTELKVEIPDELKEDFKAVSEIDVSLAISRLVKEELERLARLKAIVSKSKLTENDVRRLSAKVDKSLAKRFMQSAISSRSLPANL